MRRRLTVAAACLCVVVLPLGYGRKKAGYTGTNKGFNAYSVRTSNALWRATAGAESVKKNRAE